MSNLSKQQDPAAAGRHFRDVLGQLPTGVAVIASVNSDGTPVGMSVGSLTSVSLDPPLVAFLPARSSLTFPQIRETGRFCASILASGQEELSTAFATKAGDRFASAQWRPAPRTGSPILAGCVAWIDCEVADVFEAGDHYIVIGRVLELEQESPSLPLLFFQGGYGTFALRSLVLATRGNLNEPARIAELARGDLEALSADVGLECRVFAREGAELVIMATTGYEGPADRVGVVVPFCPPFGTTFAAWSAADVRTAWYDAAPVSLSSAQRARLDEELDEVRRRGWTFTYASEPTEEVAQLLETIAEHGNTPRRERALRDAGTRMTDWSADPATLDEQTASSVRSIAAPILNEHGPILHLLLRGFGPASDLSFVTNARDRLLEVSRRLTKLLGGQLR